MADLFLSNIPFDCNASELQIWIESHGYRVKALDLIQDMVSRVSPSFAYVQLVESSRAADAIEALNQKSLGDRILQVQGDWRGRNAKTAA